MTFRWGSLGGVVSMGSVVQDAGSKCLSTKARRGPVDRIGSNGLLLSR